MVFRKLFITYLLVVVRQNINHQIDCRLFNRYSSPYSASRKDTTTKLGDADQQIVHIELQSSVFSGLSALGLAYATLLPPRVAEPVALGKRPFSGPSCHPSHKNEHLVYFVVYYLRSFSDKTRGHQMEQIKLIFFHLNFIYISIHQNIN